MATIKPAFLTGSNFRPYLPPTIVSDWENYLNTDIPNAVYTFKLYPDWYNKDNVTEFRGECLSIEWKSKTGNADMSEKLKTSHSIPLKKGDIVVRDDGDTFIVDWHVTSKINTIETQVMLYNIPLVVYRLVPRTVDSRTGKVIEQEHTATICEEIPSIIMEFMGRPDYGTQFNSPGVISDSLMTMKVQFNSQTKDIRVDDEFNYGPFRYRIINISYAEITPDFTSGILSCHCKRVAGEFTEL